MTLTSLILIFISSLLSQDHIDVLINDVLSGSRDSAAIYLEVIEKKYPNNPKMLFLKGLMEPNGKDAMHIFADLYNMHPTSNYGDDAVMKVAEYYYSAGLYMQSAAWLKKMPLYYTRSEHIERAVKLFLNSLVVSGHRDTAVFYSKVFKRQFPSMDVDGKINTLLKESVHTNNSSAEFVSPKTSNKVGRVPSSPTSIILETKEYSGMYSLQSGAFGLEKNAVDQRINLLAAGYDARITELYRQDRVLFAVRIGYYLNKRDAQAIRHKIKSKMDLSTIIVINE